MSFTILYHPAVKRDVKKLNKSVAKIIQKEISQEIANNPFNGKQIKSRFSIYAWRIRKSKTDYRIAYEIRQDKQEVVVLMIKSRENFYKELDKRI